AAPATLTGGIGVLSMMLDSVRERRTEIGSRLAVGARRRDVLLQLFLERLFIVTLGGVLGVALGIAGSELLGSPTVRAGVRAGLNDLIPVPALRVRTIVGAAGILAATGLFSALVPAWRASALDPAVRRRG